jgi:hypothetical protein
MKAREPLKLTEAEAEALAVEWGHDARGQEAVELVQRTIDSRRATVEEIEAYIFESARRSNCWSW